MQPGGFARWIMILSAAAMAASTPATASTAAATPAQAPAADAQLCVSSVLSQMTLEQQVGQLFVMGVSGTAPTQLQLDTITTQHLGGVVLIGHTAAGLTATRQLTDALQAKATSTAGVALWVSADQEGGYVQVLNGPGVSAIPTALSQGGMAPADLRSAATSWGAQLLSAGVNLNLAPVLDTVPASLGTGNIPIGYYDREYGYDPGAVTAHGTAFAAGMTNARVQTTGKHFPGLGRVVDNTDTTFGVTDDVTTRGDSYLQPFAAAVAQGLPVVMISEARYSRIDGLRAVFSATVMQTMLRGDLGFSGVIMSDSLDAAAVSDLTPAQRAIGFLAAGGTVVLDGSSADIPLMVSAVLAQSRQDPGFAAQLQADAKTVLETKYQAGLVSCPDAANPIAQHYAALGGAASVLGLPVGPEYPVAGGRGRNYQRGSILWSARTGAFEVHGAIGGHYWALDGPAGFLGFPVTDETATPDGVGRHNNFDGGTGGSIYWTPATGAWSVHGGILAHWGALGWERGPIGYPVSDETGSPDGVGRYNNFDGGIGGSIYWTPATGAWSVQGAIRAHWGALGWERGVLGYPVSDETGSPDGVGRYNNFSGVGGSASIYWTPLTGPHDVLGAIRARWGSLGWERGALGYPVTDEYDITGGRRSDFQHGSIIWDRASNTTIVIYA
ncbi:glycoside hydrolase family 3 N-terminal domain-containing protein [Arthrobacter sp. H14-L1]|uniref:glycoside hydrolase family 3 N-terminal domain-containing protein n=1 Tax=Arthrobacter sp. H14-L1 TaxID=2996697 RepID=UPI00226E71E1|nr:glycoside hydrolase family 3 N-terminal domain-containing protein [Arthrobacter sp. H14-L1]MCY0903511.1 hypothetical protein [Arthrobacter sp. H14-L1]